MQLPMQLIFGVHKNIKKSELIKGRQRGWKWGTKTEHRKGCQKETLKVMKKKKQRRNKNRDCKK